MKARHSYRGAGLPGTVRSLGATSFFQDVASEMVYPLLPRFLVALGGGPALLGVMESVAQGLQAVIQGAAGRWSDRAGRRKPFVAGGYGLSALGRPLMALAAATSHVVALRAIDRLAKGLRTAPRDALIAEATPESDRAFAFSYHRGLDHLGAACGPLAAALVLLASDGSLRLVFALATVPAVVGWAVVQFGVREPGRPEVAAAAAPRPPAPFRVPRRLRLPLVAFFLFSLGNASDAFLLLRAGEVGYSAAGVTLLWSGFSVAKWLASAPAGRWADRIGKRRPILAGWAIYAVVYLGFAAVEGPVGLAALLALYALFYGLTEGVEKALVVELTGGETGAGTSLGVFHFATGTGVFLSSLLFGAVWEWASPFAAFALGAALAASASLLLAASGRSRRDPVKIAG